MWRESQRGRSNIFFNIFDLQSPWVVKADDPQVRLELTGGTNVANQDTSWLRTKEAAVNKNKHVPASSRISSSLCICSLVFFHLKRSQDHHPSLFYVVCYIFQLSSCFFFLFFMFVWWYVIIEISALEDKILDQYWDRICAGIIRAKLSDVLSSYEAIYR